MQHARPRPSRFSASSLKPVDSPPGHGSPQKNPERSLHIAPRVKEKIIIFTRYPEPGKSKTRLIPVLGREGAADLQRRMTEHVLAQVQALRTRRTVAVEVCYEGGDEAQLSHWLGGHLSYRRQDGEDLGSRMYAAFKHAFLAGVDRAILVGTDLPRLNHKLLEQALEALRDNDVVLGPACDGGYYLIGMKRLHPSLFQDVQWGTYEVLTRTLGIAQRNGLSVQLLETMVDVDRPEDLEVWAKGATCFPSPCLPFDSKKQAGSPDVISVIIPTLNEASNLAGTLDAVREAEEVEIIVVDGGSSDQTMEVARAYHVRNSQVPASRAGQMNAGAREARGGILLFLHADTRVPKKWANHVRTELNKPGIVGGAFTLKLDEAARWAKIIEKLVDVRSRRLKLPYGDQAIFVRAELFHTMGGFHELPIMEDFEFMRRLRRTGRISIVTKPVVTSARRWKEKGVWWTTAINQLMILGYLLGVSPRLLARIYHFKPLGMDRRAARSSKSFVWPWS